MNYIQGNSNISHTYHIYLDSDSATRAGNSFQFDISPTIEVQYPQRGNLYLKEFSGLNTLYNINATNKTNSIKVGTSTAIPRSLVVGTINTGEALQNKLNILYAPDNVTFTWDNDTLKMSAVHDSGSSLTFSGKLFGNMLNFTLNESSASEMISSIIVLFFYVGLLLIVVVVVFHAALFLH